MEDQTSRLTALAHTKLANALPEAAAMPNDGRGSYPMRIVTRLTGLNADTIRAWERRYAAITPERTGSKARLFSAADVRRLALLRDVVALGHPVSRAATYDTATLEKMLQAEERPTGATREEPAAHHGGVGRLADEYLELAERFDARRAQEHLTRAAALLSTREFLFGVVAPILRAVAERYDQGAGDARGSLVRAQIVRCLASFQVLHATERAAPKVVVATPLGARHEAGLLLEATLAMLRGLDVVYLGVGVAPQALRHAVERLGPTLLMLGVGAAPAPAEQALIDELVRSVSPRTQLWREAGDGAGDGANVRRFAGYEGLESALVDLAHRA